MIAAYLSAFFFSNAKKTRQRELDGKSAAAVANSINYLALLNIGWDVGKKKKSDFDGDLQGSLKLRDCFSRLFLSRLARLWLINHNATMQGKLKAHKKFSTHLRLASSRKKE